jgi:hypothetical protein
MLRKGKVLGGILVLSLNSSSVIYMLLFDEKHIIRLKNVIPGLLYPGRMILRLKSYLMILKS